VQNAHVGELKIKLLSLEYKAGNHHLRISKWRNDWSICGARDCMARSISIEHFAQLLSLIQQLISWKRIY